MATISFEGAQFGAPGDQNYHKAKTGLDIFFRTRRMIDPVSQKLFANYFAASDLYQIILGQKAEMRSYFRLGYIADKRSKVNPYTLSASYEINSSYQKAITEVNYRYSYNGKNSGLDMRLFAGTMVRNVSSEPFMHFHQQGEAGVNNIFMKVLTPTDSVFFQIIWVPDK